jgi:plastocyanin
MSARSGVAACLVPPLRAAFLVAASALAACGGSGSSMSSGPECTDGAIVPCYTGPAGTQGVGACAAGTQTCANGAFGACTGERLPVVETCNGVDDDCNGSADDGGAAAACTSGVCSAGACQAPTCTDGVRNGDETGPDCGGTSCPACAAGLACAIDADCLSGMCFESVCRADLNGCTPSAATDLTAQSNVTVTFPDGLVNTYTPRCIKVAAGAVVTFSGPFSQHPLQGGIIAGGTATPATSGPFATVTNTGATKDFTLATAGGFPYYCTVHGFMGMNGAVFVVP